jgi:hypothetical protein
MSIRYIGQKLAQQVSPSTAKAKDAADTKIDEELMSASGAFSLDQVDSPLLISADNDKKLICS